MPTTTTLPLPARQALLKPSNRTAIKQRRMASLASRLVWRQQVSTAGYSTPSSTSAFPRLALRPSSLRNVRPPRSNFAQRRFQSTEPPPPPPPKSTATSSNAADTRAAKEAKRRAAAERIVSSSMRFVPSFLARRLQEPLKNLFSSPGKHVVSCTSPAFLDLH